MLKQVNRQKKKIFSFYAHLFLINTRHFTGGKKINIHVFTDNFRYASDFVLYILYGQHSMVISGLRGREYKPHFSKTVLFFKNIDLCNFDEYGTCEIMELIVQLIRRSGFYTESLEWINVTDLIICCSMLNIQKRQFSPRFLSIVQNFYAE